MYSYQTQKTFAYQILLSIIMTILLIGCNKTENTNQEVVIYTALDRNFSEPILKKFQEQTGIQVRCKYDTESTKSVGLATCILEERNHPRCDVFWNNEVLHTIRLQKAGVLAQYIPQQRINFASNFYDAQGYWTGFAARARVLLVNTQKVQPNEYPKSIYDLAQPRFKGKCGIARPVAGTTATHFSVLFSYLGPEKAKQLCQQWKENQVRIESGNKSCAEKVGSGALEVALTDTDDAYIEIIQKHPVAIIYPDSELEQIGTLYIPNTIALVANSPNQENGKKLIEFLLSPEVETALAQSPSAQIPLNSQVKVKSPVIPEKPVQPMNCDFSKSAETWDQVQQYVGSEFLK